MRSTLAQIFLSKQINIFIAKSVSQQWLNNNICGPSSRGQFLLTTCKLLVKGTSLSNPKWICSHKEWDLGENVLVHYSDQDVWSQFFQHYTFITSPVHSTCLPFSLYKTSVSITSINYNPTTALRYLDQRYYINKLELEGKKYNASSYTTLMHVQTQDFMQVTPLSRRIP